MDQTFMSSPNETVDVTENTLLIGTSLESAIESMGSEQLPNKFANTEYAAEQHIPSDVRGSDNITS
ncbi:hypothetical protein WS61_13975 [Burkholderia sp. ABCPW 11]|nr:hypothetical protein WS61_13975 [Burkholderia sp. ABCPW 11]